MRQVIRFNGPLARTNIFKKCVFLGAAAFISIVPAAARDASSPAGVPLVAVLTPREGLSLNAASLEVRALVAPVQADPEGSFVFNGQTVPGRNVGRVSRVVLSLDGVVVKSLDTRRYGRQLVADFRLDLANVAEGSHTVVVTAYQHEGRHARTGQSSRSFTVDRSLVPWEPNRIEEAATPRPFGGLRVRGGDGRDDDDEEDDAWQCPPRFDLKGTLVPGAQSDGIDLARDRVAVGLGSQTAVIEPAALHCNGAHTACRFEDGSQPLLQFVHLNKTADGRWRFRLRGAGLLPEAARTLYLRIGDDWGAIDLGTGERLAGLEPTLDESRQAQASIGAAGGTVEAIDAEGVVIRLAVPEGALTQETLIKVTPLVSSPLGDASTMLLPGVKFEPEGLQFAQAATLTMDFSNSSRTLGDAHSIFLLTSPMTTLPLFGTRDAAASTLTAQLHHFSAAAPGSGNEAQLDINDWVASVLVGTPHLTLRELELLLSLLAEYQRTCTHDCVDNERVFERVADSIAALVAATCPARVSDPTDEALGRMLHLYGLAQSAGVDASGVRNCAEQVFQALIEEHGARAAIDPSPTNLARLFNDATQAQALAFDDLDTLALRKLAFALRALVERATGQCAGDAERARADLERARQWLITASALAEIDPPLAADIAAALAACDGEETPSQLDIVVTRASAGAGHLSSFVEDLINTPTPLPATLSASADGMVASLTLVRTGNSIVMNSRGASFPSTGEPAGRHNAGAQAWIRITPAESGVLSLRPNHGWASAGADPPYPYMFACLYQLTGIGGSGGGSSYCNPTETRAISKRVGAGMPTDVFLQWTMNGYNHSGSHGDGTVFTVTYRRGSNAQPVATSQTVNLDEDSTGPVILAGTDAEGDPLTYEVLTQPGLGWLEGEVPNLTFRPPRDRNGDTSFTYRVHDGFDYSDPATVTLHVASVNDPPRIDDGEGGTITSIDIYTSVDSPVDVAPRFVDADGDAVTVTVTQAPANGVTTPSGPTSVLYTPAAGFTGDDTFTIQASDGTASTLVQVTVHVIQ